MNSLENALLKALEKGDATDPAFRQRVYQAADAAMRRSLAARGQDTPDRLAEQSDRLNAAVAVIERQFGADDAVPTPAPSTQAGAATGGGTIDPVLPEAPDGPRREPRLDDDPAAPGPAEPVAPPEGPRATGEDAPGLYVEPRADARERQAETLRAERPAGERGPALRPDRGPFATVFALVVVAALVFGGLWWVITSGAFTSQEARDTSVPNPPPQVESEDFAGRDPGTATAPLRAGEGAAEGEWVTLFTPADPAALRLEGGAEASIETDPFGDYARIVTPGEDGRVYIDVPVGTLADLAGGRAQISLTARSDDGEPAQMSVTCEFGPLGDCGRRRFNVDQAESEFLFEVDLPDAAPPSEPGFVIIQTDVEAADRAINLLSARIRPVSG